MIIEYTSQSLLAAWLLSSWLVWTGGATLMAIISRYHWMVRCGGVILCFTPALLVGAYEMFWVMISSATLTVILTTGLQRFGIGPDSSNKTRPRTVRFSIGAVLFATALFAGAVAIARHTPALDERAWLSLVLISFASSVFSTVAYFGHYALKSTVLRTVIVVAVATLVAVPLVFYDWLLVSLHVPIGWPPELYIFTFGPPGIAPPTPQEWMWFGVSAIAIGCLTLWAAILSMKWGARRVVGTTGVVAVVAPPLIVTLQLLFVPEFPAYPRAENAYPDLASLSAQVAQSSFENAIVQYGKWQAIPEDQLSKIVSEIEPDLERLTEHLTRPARLAIDVSFEDMPLEDLMNFRVVARAFVAMGEAKIREGNLAGAERAYRSSIRLGVRTRHNGLLVHWLSGMGNSRIGLRAIYIHRDWFDDAARKRIIQELLALSENLEHSQSLMERERIWMMRQGWHNHLCVRLADWVGVSSNPMFNSETFEQQFLEEQTLFQLLATGDRSSHSMLHKPERSSARVAGRTRS